MNLGIGIPEIIGSVAAEEGFGPSLTLAADSGIIGGIPCRASIWGPLSMPKRN